MRRASRCWSTSRPGSSAIYPAAFGAALLNSQPMGFYAPAQIVRDMREHGVEVRHARRQPSRSGTATLEPISDGRGGSAVRLGLRSDRRPAPGGGGAQAAWPRARDAMPFRDVADLHGRAPASRRPQVRRLAEADAHALARSWTAARPSGRPRAMRDAPGLAAVRGEGRDEGPGSPRCPCRAMPVCPSRSWPTTRRCGCR